MSLENMRYLVYTMYSIIPNVNGTMIHSMVIAGQLLGECGALWGEHLCCAGSYIFVCPSSQSAHNCESLHK